MTVAPALRAPRTVLDIVAQTRAIGWLIDEWIADGRDDDWIAARLPLGIAFITGRIDEHELRRILGASALPPE